MLRPIAIPRVVATLVLIAVGLAPAGAAPGAKQLVRVHGTVQYQTGPSAAYRPLFGSLNLPDDAIAVTLANSQGLLRLADSSEVDIGERARVQVGAFNAVTGSGANVTIGLQVGAIHFIVRHPQGAHANYVFTTATTQIAVRGTEGYIVAGPKGTDFYCAKCEAGDVTMRVGKRAIPLVTGQQVIFEVSPTGTKTTVIKAPCSNPAAIAVSHGKLGRTIPRSKWVDTTGALTADPLKAPTSTP